MYGLRGWAIAALVAGGLGFVGIGIAGAGTIPVGADLQDYLDLAQDSAYDAVGMFSWDGGLASGTYIGDGWVLTAAHVAEASDSLTFTVGGIDYYSEQIIINDNWTGDVRKGGDLALIKLTEDITGSTAAQLYNPTGSDTTDTTDDSVYNGIPGIDLSGQGFGPSRRFGGHWGHHFGRFGGPFHGPWVPEDDNELIGQVVTFVGYGMTGDGETGAVDEGGTKIAGQNTIDRTGASVFGYDDALMFIDFDDPDAEESFRHRIRNLGGDAVDLEYLIASGDSGGGVFIEDENGDSYLLGVTSFLLAYDGSLDADYGDLGAFTAIDGYLDWVYEVTALDTLIEADEAAAALVAAVESNASAVDAVATIIPEPGVLMMALSGVTLLMLRRRDA